MRRARRIAGLLTGGRLPQPARTAAATSGACTGRFAVAEVVQVPPRRRAMAVVIVVIVIMVAIVVAVPGRGRTITTGGRGK